MPRQFHSLLFFLLLLPLPSLGQEPTTKDSLPQIADSVTVQLDSLAAVLDSMLADSPVAVIAGEDSLLRDSLADAMEAIYFLRDQLIYYEQALARAQATAHRRLRYEQFTGTYAGNYGTWEFHTCLINPEQVKIELYNQKKKGKKGVHTFGSVAQMVSEEGKELVFAMNAGMYERTRIAKGLLIMEGEKYQQLDTLRKGYGNFYMQPNGVFAIDSLNQAHVLTTQAYRGMADSISFRIATQSGPMMVINRKINPKFNDGSPNRHIRNAVGVTPQNEVVFAISTRPVTFFELSTYMIQQGCTNVLYLDGAISQAYMPELGRNSLVAGNGLGPIVVITE